MRYPYLFIGVYLFTQTFVYSFNDEPACFRELQRSFFSYQLVDQALSLHNITQSRWEPIRKSLDGKSTLIPLILRQKASQLVRDPLEYPFQVEIAENLLQEVLFEVFREVMFENGVVSESDIGEMFMYIGMHQNLRWLKCLKADFGKP